MAVLYRKYRPQTFAEVVGQKAIITTLQNQVSAGQVAHAYLFVGSRGVGKTSVARILAKAVNCKKRSEYNELASLPTGRQANAPKGEACGECEVCQAVANGNYIDLIEIDAASNTGVDNVRELIEHVRFSPATGKFKIFIIDEVHMLSKGAFSALLKTLEEPPKHAIFVLATTEINKVPATIISRTQRFDFKRLSVLEIENQLAAIISKENMELPKEAVRLIAQHSAGGLRDALSLLDKVFTLGNQPAFDEVLQLIGITDTHLLEKFLDLIISGQAGELPSFIDQLLEKGADFVIFNRDFLEYLRQVLVLKIAKPENLTALADEHLAAASVLASKLSENEILFIIRLFLRSLKEQTAAPSADLPVLLASVEAAFRKNSSNLLNSQSVNHQPVKSAALSAAPKIETAASPAKNPDAPEPQKSASGEALLAVELSQATIAAEWPRVIEKLKNINGPLTQLLKSSPLERVDGARIIVAVKYKFHKQNLEYPKNQEAVAKILREIYGQNLAIGGEVVAQPEPEKPSAGGLADAIKVFGGELIE